MSDEKYQAVGESQKPNLKREQLKNNGIIFKENTAEIEELEDRLHPIRRSLTRIPDRFPVGTHEIFDDELQQFKLTGQDRHHVDVESWCLGPGEAFKQLDERIYGSSKLSKIRRQQHREGLEIAEDVRSYCEDRENEEKLRQLLLKHIFLEFKDKEKGSSRYNKTLEGWEVHCEVRWTEFSERSKNGRISEPKPDITYGFPIIKPSDEAYQTLQGDPNVDNFSLPTLGNLRSGADTKLVFTPGKALLRWATKKQKSLKAMHLMCFPWAIVEVKHGTPNPCKDNERESKDHDRRTESCYCQAANASAAALILQEDLAKKAKTEFEPEDAQVVFAYTCVGSTAKLWITYRMGPSRDSPKTPGEIVMQCIWTTSLGVSWGIIALCRVVKNVAKWVNTHIRPNIVRWIGQILLEKRQTKSLTPSGDTVNYRRRAVSLGPADEESDSEELDTPASRHQYLTPRGKERPNLQHGKTAPAAFKKISTEFKIPRITYNNFTQHDEENSSTSSDEGHARTPISGRRSRSRVNRGDLFDFVICEDTSEEDPDDPYVPTSSSDEDGDSDDVEDEDSEDASEREDGEISKEELKGLLRDAGKFLRPESPEYHFELPDRSIHSSRVDVQLTPTKGSRRLSVSSERRSKKDKRGSARF